MLKSQPARTSQLLTKQQNFTLVQIEIVCRRQNRCEWKLKFGLGREEDIVEKGENAGYQHLPAFSPFPTMFSRALCFRVVKSRDYVVNNPADILWRSLKLSLFLKTQDKLTLALICFRSRSNKCSTSFLLVTPCPTACIIKRMLFKTLWKKMTALFTSIFFFSCNVFTSLFELNSLQGIVKKQ